MTMQTVLTRGVRIVAAITVAATLVLAQPVAAAESMEARVARLERQLDSQALVEMVTRLDRLEQEVQQLRGQVEEQNHVITDLRQRQRDLYLDIDRRLGRLEREGSGVATQAVAAPVMPAAAVAPAIPATAAANATDGAAPATTTPTPVAPVVTAPVTAVATAPAAAPAAAVAPVSAVVADQERESYQQAFDQLRELRYEQAIAAFRDFLAKYPDGRYGHIAQYWIGEANYAQRNFRQAIADYQVLLQHYPKSPKLAEAMLKIGYSQYELGDKAAARKALQDLAQLYPDTTEAGQANAFLQKMRGEGN